MKNKFPFLEEKQDSLILSLFVRPNSRKEQILIEADKITILITEPPIEGKANKTILKILSKFLKVPVSKIEIIKGIKSHDKKIAINDLSDIQKNNIKKAIQDYEDLNN